MINGQNLPIHAHSSKAPKKSFKSRKDLFKTSKYTARRNSVFKIQILVKLLLHNKMKNSSNICFLFFCLPINKSYSDIKDLLRSPHSAISDIFSVI